LSTSGQSNDDAQLMNRTQKFVDMYAEEGLRTLLLAKKDIEAGAYE